MLKNTLLITILIFALGFKAIAPGILYNVTNGSISFRSNALLELIKANSNELKGVVDVTKKQFAFKVRIASFTGFNSPLQKEHFNENYMESNTFPYADFEGKIIEDIDLEREGTYNVRAKGNLAIHGISQERIIKSELVVKNKIFKSEDVIKMNVTIPKVVHEKLASEIYIEVKATLISK